jgi:anti-anti-sigma regulatory factor
VELMMTGTVEDMCAVRHACLVPVSTEHLWEVTSRWLATGLDAKERVVYFADGTEEMLLRRLGEDSVAVDPALDSGQLLIVTTEQTRAVVDGPAAGLRVLLRDHADQAAVNGWTGLRLAGEGWHALRRSGPGVGKLLELEDVLEEAAIENPNTRMLCRYDQRHFDAATVGTLRAAHHTELVTPEMYDDNLLRISTVGPSGVRLAGEVDHSNRAEISRALDGALDSVLRSPMSATEITVDVSSLRFLDVGGAMELVRAADRFPDDHLLVVVGAAPRVVRVLDRCGAPFAPRLVVRPRAGG